MYNQNMVCFWNEHVDEEPEFSDYLQNQQVYNFKTIELETVSIHIFDDGSIVIHEDECELILKNSLNRYLIEVLNDLYVRNVEIIDTEDLEKINYIQEVLECKAQ